MDNWMEEVLDSCLRSRMPGAELAPEAGPDCNRYLPAPSCSGSTGELTEK